jgi:hypothetical protein
VQKAKTNKSQEVLIMKKCRSNVRTSCDEWDGFSSVVHGCVFILIKTGRWYGSAILSSHSVYKFFVVTALFPSLNVFLIV